MCRAFRETGFSASRSSWAVPVPRMQLPPGALGWWGSCPEAHTGRVLPCWESAKPRPLDRSEVIGVFLILKEEKLQLATVSSDDPIKPRSTILYIKMV